MIKKCENCGDLTKNKNLGKINGIKLCKKCKIELRKKHREETIKSQGIKKILKDLKNKINRERNYAIKSYGYKNKINKTKNNRDNDIKLKVKGSKFNKLEEKTNSYLSFEESKNLIKMLMNRGMEYEEAVSRIKNLKEILKDTRKQLQKEKKSEKEIRIKQKQMIEELWKI